MFNVFKTDAACIFSILDVYRYMRPSEKKQYEKQRMKILDTFIKNDIRNINWWKEIKKCTRYFDAGDHSKALSEIIAIRNKYETQEPNRFLYKLASFLHIQILEQIGNCTEMTDGHDGMLIEIGKLDHFLKKMKTDNLEDDDAAKITADIISIRIAHKKAVSLFNKKHYIEAAETLKIFTDNRWVSEDKTRKEDKHFDYYIWVLEALLGYIYLHMSEYNKAIEVYSKLVHDNINNCGINLEGIYWTDIVLNALANNSHCLLANNCQFAAILVCKSGLDLFRNIFPNVESVSNKSFEYFENTKSHLTESWALLTAVPRNRFQIDAFAIESNSCSENQFPTT